MEHDRILEAYHKRAGLNRDQFFGYENPAHVYRIYERYLAILMLLRQHKMLPLDDKHILDVGCGEGGLLRQFIEWGADPQHLAGLDIRPEPLERAQTRNPAIDFQVQSGTELPQADASFDIVCQQTVFTSILDDVMRQQVAAEMMRVLKPNGLILWYDFRYGNPRNPDVRAVTRAEIAQLFPNFELHLRRITLAPPLARRLPDSWVPLFYPLLASLPFLRTHYLGVLAR